MARDPTLGQLFGVGVPKTEVIGIRIIMIVEVPEYQGYERMQQIEATVTVNALASDTLGDAMARAVAYVNNGNLGLRRGQPTPGTVITADAEQLYQGGYDAPTIWM
jgi:hypothetical protein